MIFLQKPNSLNQRTYCHWLVSALRLCASCPDRGSWTGHSPGRGPRRPGPGPRTVPSVSPCPTTSGTPSGPRRREPCRRSSESASPAAEPRRRPSTAGPPGGQPAGPPDPAFGLAEAPRASRSAPEPRARMRSGEAPASALDQTQISCFRESSNLTKNKCLNIYNTVLGIWSFKKQHVGLNLK